MSIKFSNKSIKVVKIYINIFLLKKKALIEFIFSYNYCIYVYVYI